MVWFGLFFFCQSYCVWWEDNCGHMAWFDPPPSHPHRPNPPKTKQFQSVEAAVHACILLHNQEVNGNVLYVTFSDADGL